MNQFIKLLSIAMLLLFSKKSTAQDYMRCNLPSVNGPTEVSYFIHNHSEAVYSINPGIGPTIYSWTVPAGVNMTEDNGTSLKVTFDKNFVSGTIAIRMENKKHVGCVRYITVKCSDSSKPVLLTAERYI